MARDDETQPSRESAPESAEPASFSERETPAIIGSYARLEKLASGGFGVVYRARHCITGEDAAIKILHPELAANDVLVRRFEREVEVLQRVRHPGIVQVLEVGRLEGKTPYFVMELLRGATLHEYLSARGRLPADEALAILAPLVEALTVAHENLVVHRDLKASNVFLDERDGRRRVVLLDFGVAKLLDVSAPGLTASRHVIGTFSCMAPEQLLSGPVDARTDVYALGVLVYRMLTGQPLFENAPYLVMHHMHLHARPARPSSRAPINPAFDDVVLRALSKAQSGRQPSAAAFLEELRAVADRPKVPEHEAPRAEVIPVVAVRFEARVGDDVPDDADDVFADIERLPAVAIATLRGAGLSVVMEAGTTVVFSIERPEAAAEDLALRRRILGTVLDFARRLDQRDGGDARVAVDVCVFTARVTRSTDGASPEADLLDFLSLVPAVTGAGGVLASRDALDGIAVDAMPVETEGDIELLRLAPGATIADA
jgi:serine/threonine-protein kinase